MIPDLILLGIVLGSFGIIAISAWRIRKAFKQENIERAVEKDLQALRDAKPIPTVQEWKDYHAVSRF